VTKSLNPTIKANLSIYTRETHKPSSFFSTLTRLFLLNPFMALSHFLLLNPVCPFNSFRSMDELSFRILKTAFSSSVSSIAFAYSFICGKYETWNGNPENFPIAL
jgi:hypothetical protein